MGACREKYITRRAMDMDAVLSDLKHGRRRMGTQGTLPIDVSLVQVWMSAASPVDSDSLVNRCLSEMVSE